MFPELGAPLPLPAGSGQGEDYTVTVFGHEPALAALAGAETRGRLRQAYLFAGPPGVGKRTVARWFAQRLACLGPIDAARPCGHCRACRLVAAGAWPDVIEAEAPLRIEASRALQHDLALAPGESRHRVAILPDVDTASLGAANSLLKTLEEPPRQALLLLTTGDLGAVLPTVRSRCQLLVLRPLTTRAAAAALCECWAQPAEQAELLARLAGGRLGWAVRALGDEGNLAARARWLDGLARARATGLPGRLAVAAELARSGDPPPEILAAWASWWRDVLLLGQGLAESVVNRDQLAELEAAAARYAPAQVLAGLRAIELALRRLAANAGPQLTLEVLLMELP